MADHNSLDGELAGILRVAKRGDLRMRCARKEGREEEEDHFHGLRIAKKNMEAV